VEFVNLIVVTIVFSIFVIFMGLFVQAGFLLWGMRITGIENRSFGKAIMTTLFGGIISFVFSLFLYSQPLFSAIFSLIGDFLVTALLMIPIFNTTFGKALGASILAWVLSLVIIGGIVFLMLLFITGSIIFAN